MAFKTPGVYIEEIPKFPPSIVAVETAIPAFIGYTEKATDPVTGQNLKLKPTRIASLVEFDERYGGPQKETALTVSITDSAAGATSNVASLDETKRSKHILTYAMRMFFLNGGGPCYVVSVGTYTTPVGGALNKKDLEDGISALLTEDEPTLIVVPEAQSLGTNDFNTVMEQALAECALLQDRFVIMDLNGGTDSLSNPKTVLITAVNTFRSTGLSKDLKYGAAYGPNIETTLDFDVDATAIDVTYTPAPTTSAPATPSPKKLNALDSRLRALADAAIRDLPCKLPPSSAVAGVYARVDASRGVWKAPANEGLVAVIKPTIAFGNTQQDVMNVDATSGKSVNAIRSFVGRGTLVWGARTLAGNDNEWRYVNVRRFFIMAEESTKKASATFVFEPNDANTWVRMQAMIENFLTTLWRQGALQGAKPEHAFYVAIGLGRTMTAVDILEGRLIVEIGMAVVRPAEFIVLRFSHLMAKS